jgi:hypothetical protein
MKVLEDVILPIVREIALKMEEGEAEYFDKDPVLYTVALLLEAKKKLRPGTAGTTNMGLAVCDENVKDANRLLKRKKITLLLPQ